MDFKANIKAICKARGMTFAQLAEDLNITRQTLHRQTTGNATTDTLSRIANALQVPPFILIHPAPLAALQRWNAGQDQDAGGRHDHSQAGTLQDPAGPVVICPRCGAPLLLSIQVRQEAGQDEQPETSEARQDQGARDQEQQSSQDQQQHNSQSSDQSAAEEMKLF